MVFGILAGIFIGIPFLIGTAYLVVNKVRVILEEEEEKQQEFEEYQNTYDKILQSNYYDTETGAQGSVKELPQLTFQRWLTFYNSSPENWDIDECSTLIGKNKQNNYCVPTYYKKIYNKGHFMISTAIPIFWTDALEMRKFEQWINDYYKEGKTSGYERKRDESLEQLAEFLQEDIEARRKKIQEDYARVVDSVKIEGSDIELQLQEGKNAVSGGV